MESEDGDRLEKGLLAHSQLNDDDEEEVLYSASFEEEGSEDNLIKLKTIEWILYSLLLIFAWGFGFLMLLYLPLRRYLLRRTIRSQRLYLNPNSIVYTVTKPAAVPCSFGVLKIEKHILLHSVSDVIVQQGYLQSRYGVYSVRIQNATHTIIQIQGIANPNQFRNAVLTRLSNITNETFRQDVASSKRSLQAPLSPLKAPTHDTLSHVGEFDVLQKLDQVGNSLKRVQSLIKERQQKTSQCKD